MKPHRLTLFLLSTLLLGACASAPKAGGEAVATPAAVIDATTPPDAEADTTTAPGAAEAEPAAGQAAPTAGIAAAEAAPAAADEPDAVDDYAAIYGEDPYDPVADPTLPPAASLPVSYDPWEKFNRKVHRFNTVVDNAVARPIARGYVKVVPRPVRRGVSNFFDNLGEPLTMVNSLLQGKPKRAGQALGRFLLNSTVGIAGIFDPASDAGLQRKDEDFGQTLGTWGWKRSRYVELPFFGPRTLRDTIGLVADAPLSPTLYIDDDKTRLGLQGLNLVNLRANLLSLDAQRVGAVDDYALVRDAWLQRRNYQIESDRKPKEGEEQLPDYLMEEEQVPDVPMNAMPQILPPAP